MPDELRGRAASFQRYLDEMPSTLDWSRMGHAAVSSSQPPLAATGSADDRASMGCADVARQAVEQPSEASADESALPLVDSVVSSHWPLDDATVEVDDAAGVAEVSPADSKPAWDCCDRHEIELLRWLDNMPLGHDDAAPVPHDIWRGLPVSRMLSQGPSLMANSQTEATFLLSEQLEAGLADIDIFLSHTWSSNEYLKYVAMLYHFNGRSSFLAAHSAALATFLVLLAVKQLTPYGGYLPVFYVPMPGNVEEYPRGLPVCGPCFFVGCVVQVGAYVFGHLIWSWAPGGGYQKTVFLDKCCIHQVDAEKKRRGVEHVGSFVKQSRTMFIPFDDDYFERLWCAYELAAFVRYKKSDVINRLNFMPIKVAVFVFGIALLGFVGTTGFMFMVAVNDLLFQFWIPQNWLEYFAIWGTGGTLIFGVPKFIFCHLSQQSRKILDDKLANFTVRDAKVTVEDDRNMIEQCIREWFGSVQVFDLIVQRVFPEIVNRALGTEQQALRFADVLQENAGVLFLFIYDASLVAYPNTERVARALATGFSAHCVIDPLFLYSLNMLAQAALRLELRLSTWTCHLLRGLGVFVLGLAYPAWFAFCISSPVRVVGAVTLALGLLVPLIFRM